jgi:hypothetical protein
VRQPLTADRPGVCVHAAAHPQRKGLAATTLRGLAGLGHVQLGDFFVQTFLAWQLPACSSAANGILGCNQCSRFDGNVNGTSGLGACVECRKRPLLISHFVCGGPAEVRYCCCRIDLLDDVCLVSRSPFVKTRKLVLCRSAGHHVNNHLRAVSFRPVAISQDLLRPPTGVGPARATTSVRSTGLLGPRRSRIDPLRWMTRTFRRTPWWLRCASVCVCVFVSVYVCVRVRS